MTKYAISVLRISYTYYSDIADARGLSLIIKAITHISPFSWSSVALASSPRTLATLLPMPVHCFWITKTHHVSPHYCSGAGSCNGNLHSIFNAGTLRAFLEQNDGNASTWFWLATRICSMDRQGKKRKISPCCSQSLPLVTVVTTGLLWEN